MVYRQPQRPQQSTVSTATRQRYQESTSHSYEDGYETRTEQAKLQAEREASLRREREHKRLEEDRRRAQAAQVVLIEEFRKYCCTHAGYLPPDVLLSESTRLKSQFVQRKLGSWEMLSRTEKTALTLLQRELIHEERRIEEKLEMVRTELLKSKPWFKIKKRRLLSQVEVSHEPPEVGEHLLEAFDRNVKYVSIQKDAGSVIDEAQGAFSVIKDPERNISYIQLCSPEFGCVYLTVPSSLNPTEVARDVLALLSKPMAASLEGSDPVLMLNGDAQEVNVKAVLSDKVVLKAATNEPEHLSGVSARVRTLYGRSPLTPENTRILSGLPTSQAQLSAVFSAVEAQPAWETWSEVAPKWQSTAESTAFPLETNQTSEAFLSALETEENVIVLVAHAETGAVFFPEPRPNGSRVTPEDILALKDKITKNGPSVYLFCCETARYAEGVASVKDALLEAGATSVVAPQIIVGAHTSRKLFSEFMQRASVDVPIRALKAAEAATQNRDMEAWVG